MEFECFEDKKGEKKKVTIIEDDEEVKFVDGEKKIRRGARCRDWGCWHQLFDQRLLAHCLLFLYLFIEFFESNECFLLHNFFLSTNISLYCWLHLYTNSVWFHVELFRFMHDIHITNTCLRHKLLFFCAFLVWCSRSYNDGLNYNIYEKYLLIRYGSKTINDIFTMGQLCCYSLRTIFFKPCLLSTFLCSYWVIDDLWLQLNHSFISGKNLYDFGSNQLRQAFVVVPLSNPMSHPEWLLTEALCYLIYLFYF